MARRGVMARRGPMSAGRHFPHLSHFQYFTVANFGNFMPSGGGAA
jgi:hypothetical protein